VTVTKIYYGSIEFEAGSAELTDESSREIRMVIFRAHMIPEHWIDIVTHEDPTDSHDKGMAVRRLDTLRRFCLAESISEERIVLHTHYENCASCREFPGKFARRANACAFPRIASLSDEIGESYLSFAEVVTLQSAREALMSKDYERWEELEKQHSPAGWKRIVGHDSLREWLRAGADHPLYGPAFVKVPYRMTAPCPYCGKPLRTSVAKQCRYCRKDWHDPENVGMLSL
jgi:hypothetical protein